MIALARWPSRAPILRGGKRNRRLFLAPAFLLSFFAAAPVSAQVSATISVESDYRHRGYSLSAGEPVAVVDLGYDHSSGIYLNGSAIAVIDGDDGPALLGGQANIGYAARIGPGISADAGILRTEYTDRSSARRPYHYTEAYVGLAAHGLSSRVYYSPDYYRPGRSTLYFELETAMRPAPNWTLSGHVGALTYLSEPPRFANTSGYDWRVGVSRRWGAFDVHASVSGGGPRNDYYRGSVRDRTALVGGVSLTF